MLNLFIFGIGGGELVVIIVLVLLLFGGKKIPELMKGIGKGVKSFRDGVEGVADDEKKEGGDSAAGK